MNDIIERIQQDILNPAVPLADIFLKAKLLAHQLKNEEFKQWVKHEVDGYPEAILVPDYRKLPVESLGTFSNGVYTHSNQPMMLSEVPDDLKETVAHVWITQGIRSIEEMARQGTLYAIWKGDWIGYFNYHNMGNMNTYHLVEARRPILGSTFAQILQTVRSRLQDFILELSDLPWNIAQGQPPQGQIEQLVAVTIYNNAQGGNVSTFDQRGQQVQSQNNAAGDVNIAGDININTIQTPSDFIRDLQRVKGELTKASEAQIIDAEIVTDADYEIASAIQEAKKPTPNKKSIIEHVDRAKGLLENVTATAGLATALVKLVEAAQKLF